MTGFAKVGIVGGVGQTMARTVARRKPYADDTRPPVAFVHGNNFYAEEPKTRAYASVAFRPEGRRVPDRLEEGMVPAIGEDVSLDWIAALYRIQA